MTKKKKKEEEIVDLNLINTKADLKRYLLDIRDKLADDTAPPVYAMTALNSILSMEKIYSLLNPENKELARDIWLRLKKSGFQLQNPPILFDPEEEVVSN